MSLFRFLGLSPPPPKAARKSYPDYEKKGGRKFLEKWNKKDNGEPRDWLMYDSEEGVMRCKHCVAHAVDRKESFIVGCAVLKLDNIKKHEQTQSHIRSSAIAFAILAPDKTAGQQLPRQLTAAQALKMSTMFRTSHALVLAKHFKPVILSRLEVGKLTTSGPASRQTCTAGGIGRRLFPLWTGPRSTVCTRYPATVTSSP